MFYRTFTPYSGSIAVFCLCAALACQRPGTGSEDLLTAANIQGNPDSVTWAFPQGQRTWQLLHATFMGGERRDCGGSGSPDSLEVLWRVWLGEGRTRINRDSTTVWKGAGWTGQPLLALENGRLVLFQGAYDYHLRKLDAATGQVLWAYPFDDVIKGTGTLWLNRKARHPEEACLLIQGSRSSNNANKGQAHSLRAVSAETGRELWRLNVPRTRSRSRDVDASPLLLGDTAWVGVESGLLLSFDPNPRAAQWRDSFFLPAHHFFDTLFRPKDVRLHGSNLVVEASPARLGDRLYLACGSGHVYGFNLKTRQLDWDFYIGSDLDGSPVVTGDSCLLIAVEKEFIKGRGGLLKLDPRRPPAEAVVWYLPVENHDFSNWEGGVIGSAAINDGFRLPDEPALAAFSALDGFLYVVKHQQLSGKREPGFDGSTLLPTPEVVFRYKIGPTISTPVFLPDRLLAAAYQGVFLFSHQKGEAFQKRDVFHGFFESTPLAFGGKVYLASRDGYLYCFGNDPAGSGLLPERRKPPVKKPAPKPAPKPKAKPKPKPKTPAKPKPKEKPKPKPKEKPKFKTVSPKGK